MTPADLENMEQELGLVLPEPYRQAMLTFPFPRDSYATDLWLLSEPALILEDNRQVRRGGMGKQTWPPQYLIFGGDGGEELFVLATQPPPFPVLVFELESSRFRPHADSFESFLIKKQQELAKMEEEYRQMDEVYRNRRWWQFWLHPSPRGRAS